VTMPTFIPRPATPTPATVDTTPDEETAVRLDTVQDLLTAIDALPEPEREHARRRVTAAVEQPAPAARAALGLLALDVAGLIEEMPSAEVIVLPDVVQPTAASA
jgi:hypothetical protein